MITPTDTVLAAALAPGQERSIRARVTIDWDKDSTWDAPGSTLTGDMIELVTMDDQSDAGLPDEVTGVASAGSTELKVIVSGREPTTGLNLWELFSPFTIGSPYRKVDLSGAAVKYDVLTETSTGVKTTRRFTGWVRSVEPDRKTGTVTITAANHLHIQGKRVTLPRWARHVPHQPQLPHLGVWEIPTEDRMENAPLSFAWLWQYVMRQCGAVPGPDPRANCIWFSSGYGGMIPEVGSWSDFQAGRSFMRQGIVNYRYPGVWDSSDGTRNVSTHPELGFHAPWTASKTHVFPVEIFDSYSQSGATTQIVPTTSPRYLNAGAWMGLDFADSSAFVKFDIYMDSWQYVLGSYNPVAEPDMASVRLHVGLTTTTLLIRGSGVGAATRTFTFATPAAMDDSLIYTSFEIDLANPNNSRLWFGNTLATPTGNTGTLSTYPNIHGDEGFGADKSKCRVWLRQSRYLNAEVWQSTTAYSGGGRIPTWANTDYSRKDFAIVNTGLLSHMSDVQDNLDTNWMPYVTHIPNRADVDAWELLTEMCKAAHATLFIDAYGGLRIIPQACMERYEGKLTVPMPRVTEDGISTFGWSVRYDAYRDSIRTGAATGRAIVDVAFRAEHAKQFMGVPPDNPGDPERETSYLTPPGEDVISLEAGQLFQKNSDQPIESWGTQGFHATNLDGYAPSPPAVWNADCLVYDIGRQDVYRIVIVNGEYAVPLYMAMPTNAGAGGEEINTPGMILVGMKKVVEPTVYETTGSGNRLLSVETSEWHSAPWTMESTYESMLARIGRMVPQCDNLTMPGDPRFEMFDLIRLSSGGNDAIAMITGRQDEFTPAGYITTWAVRMLSAPGDWLLGVTGVSELGISTYLS